MRESNQRQIFEPSPVVQIFRPKKDDYSLLNLPEGMKTDASLEDLWSIVRAVEECSINNQAIFHHPPSAVEREATIKDESRDPPPFTFNGENTTLALGNNEDKEEDCASELSETEDFTLLASKEHPVKKDETVQVKTVEEDEESQNEIVKDEGNQDDIVKDEGNQDGIVKDEESQDDIVEDKESQDGIVEDKESQDDIVEDKESQDDIVEDEESEDDIVEDEENQDDIVEEKIKKTRQSPSKIPKTPPFPGSTALRVMHSHVTNKAQEETVHEEKNAEISQPFEEACNGTINCVAVSRAGDELETIEPEQNPVPTINRKAEKNQMEDSMNKEFNYDFFWENRILVTENEIESLSEISKRMELSARKLGKEFQNQ